MRLTFLLMEYHTIPEYVIALSIMRTGLNPLPAPNNLVAAAAHGHPCSDQTAPEGPGPVYALTVRIDFDSGHSAAFLWFLVCIYLVKDASFTFGRPSCAGFVIPTKSSRIDLTSRNTLRADSYSLNLLLLRF